MKTILRPFHLLNSLSIDIALGAVASSLFFAHHSGSLDDYKKFLVLGIAVFIIYSMDHLIDVRKFSNSRLSARHFLHEKYFAVIRIVVMVFGLIAFIISVTLPKIILISGGSLSIIVLIYLLFQANLKYGREFFGSLIYVAGITIPSIEKVEIVNAEYSNYVILFFGIVLINLILFSWFDYNDDISNGQKSIVTKLGRKKADYLLTGLITIQILLIFFFNGPQPISIETGIFLCMTAVLLLAFILRDRLIADDNYRILADSVFYFPAIILLV